MVKLVVRDLLDLLLLSRFSINKDKLYTKVKLNDRAILWLQ